MTITDLAIVRAVHAECVAANRLGAALSHPMPSSLEIRIGLTRRHVICDRDSVIDACAMLRLPLCDV